MKNKLSSKITELDRGMGWDVEEEESWRSWYVGKSPQTVNKLCERGHRFRQFKP